MLWPFFIAIKMTIVDRKREKISIILFFYFISFCFVLFLQANEQFQLFICAVVFDLNWIADIDTTIDESRRSRPFSSSIATNELTILSIEWWTNKNWTDCDEEIFCVCTQIFKIGQKRCETQLDSFRCSLCASFLSQTKFFLQSEQFLISIYCFHFSCHLPEFVCVVQHRRSKSAFSTATKT